jgi:hypothetical protein
VSGDANTTATAGAVSASAAPTATVGHGEQTHAHPPGSARPEGGTPTTERPEALVGAAFAGGLAFALILKRLGR